MVITVFITIISFKDHDLLQLPKSPMSNPLLGQRIGPVNLSILRPAMRAPDSKEGCCSTVAGSGWQNALTFASIATIQTVGWGL
jgi:hypothetical protein